MLRLTLVLLLIGFGTYFTLQTPFYALLFYIGNAYFRPEEWVYSDIIRSLNLSFIIGLYLVLATCFSKHKIVWNGRVFLIGVFVLQSFLSAALSEHADYCWPYFLQFTKVALISYLIIVLTSDFAKFRLVLLVMVFALGVEQGKQGWFYLLTKPGWPNDNPVPFLGDNNGVALGMLMIVPMIGLLYQTSNHKWSKPLFAGLFIGCLYRALSTYSRGGFIAAAGMGLAWWLFSAHKLKVGTSLILVLLLVVPALPPTYWSRMETIQTYEKEEDASALGRFHFWNVALKMAAANPILGVGFNGYNKAYDTFDFSSGAFGRERSVHSSYFGVLAELGYPGLLLYSLILGLCFASCFRVRRLAGLGRVPVELGKGAIALATSLVVFVIGGAFLPSQYAENVWHILGLTIVLKEIALRHLSAQSASATVNAANAA